MTFRTISFICITLSALFLPLWVFAVMVVGYVFAFGPYELLFLAVCIDSAYGSMGIGMWYSYTLTVSTVTIGILCAKPHVRFGG